MATHYTNDFSFDLPEGFVDKTPHRLVEQGSESGVAVVANRVKLRDIPLLMMVSRYLEIEANRCDKLEVLLVDTRWCGAVEVLVVSHRLVHRGVSSYQASLHAEVSGIWLRIACMSGAGNRLACDAALAHILETLQLRSLD